MPVGLGRGVFITRIAPLTVMPAAALAVHQLRYWLAFGSRAGTALQGQGHAYLHSLVPWIVLLIAIAAGAFLRALGRALTGQCSVSRYTVSLTGLWLACAACLLAIFVSQELLEGWFATGHPAGLAGIFGSGGWWSIPAASAVGLVLAALYHGARWLLHEVAVSHAAGRPSVQIAAIGGGRGRERSVLRPVPLADGWSGRGPPV